MKYIILLILMVVNLKSSYGQNYFQKIFGDSTVPERGQLVYQTPDGTIYFFGTAQEGISNDSEITLHKFSSNGNLLLKQTYFGVDNEFIISMIYHNGLFTIVGEKHIAGSNNIDGLIVTIDTSGQMLKTRSYGVSAKTESLHGISKTADGGYIVCGFATGTSGSNDFLTIKYDAGFDIEWEQIMGSTLNDVGMKAVELPNGNFFSTGDQQQAAGHYNVYCQVFDSNGTFLYDKVIASPHNGGSKNMLLDSENNILIIGEMNNAASIEFDVYLVKLDVNTNLIWTKYNTTDPGGDAGFCIIEPNIGDYVIAGYGFNPVTQNQDALLLSTDTSGNTVNIKYYGGMGNDISYSVVPSVNGGFLVAGVVYIGSDNQYFLIYDDIQLAVGTVAKPKMEDNLSIFPNPLTQQVFRFNKAIEKVKIGIYNINGQLVEQAYFEESIEAYHLKNNLPTGNYFVNLQFENYYKTIQIIIQ